MPDASPSRNPNLHSLLWDIHEKVSKHDGRLEEISRQFLKGQEHIEFRLNTHIEEESSMWPMLAAKVEQAITEGKQRGSESQQQLDGVKATLQKHAGNWYVAGLLWGGFWAMCGMIVCSLITGTGKSLLSSIGLL